MQVKSLGANQTEVIVSDVHILYSYSTPVAAFVPGKGFLATNTKYSRTTSRHISQWTDKLHKSVDQSVIDELLPR